MVSAEVTILNKLGLHARPASKFVKIASLAKANVFIVKDGQRVNGKSILGVMMLQAEKGSRMTIEVEGENETGVLEELVELVNNKFVEE